MQVNRQRFAAMGDIAILNHLRENPQMDADGRRIVMTRRSTYRIVQIIPHCYMSANFGVNQSIASRGA